MFVAMNHFNVNPDRGDEFEEIWKGRESSLHELDGFVQFSLLKGDDPGDYISHTIDELERLAPDVVIPMHCTGMNFIAAMRERMPDRLVGSNLGSRFTFGV